MATINHKDFEDLYNHYDGFDSLCYELYVRSQYSTDIDIQRIIQDMHKMHEEDKEDEQ